MERNDSKNKYAKLGSGFIIMSFTGAIGVGLGLDLKLWTLTIPAVFLLCTGVVGFIMYLFTDLGP